MVRRVVGSIPHGGPINLFLDTTSVTSVTKAMVCGMVYIKEPLLLVGKSNPCNLGIVSTY